LDYEENSENIKIVTIIPRQASDTKVNNLRSSHVTENYLVDARKDPHTVFPLQALHQMVQLKPLYRVLIRCTDPALRPWILNGLTGGR